MDQDSFRYDVFISYSPADEEWAEDWLRPRLAQAGLGVCTGEDFDLGVPRPINIERAVAGSRHTLIVLSPTWVSSEWAQFEALLAQAEDPAALQRTLLPLLLQTCRPPRRIAALTYTDFTQEQRRETQVRRIVDAVQGKLRLADVDPSLRRLLPETTDSLAARNRSRMLEKVETFWVRSVLNQSLYQIARIELGLEYAPDAVAHPWESVVQRPGQPNKTIPAVKPVIEVFDDLGGELLILGAPGAGKTTLLLELARDLIARARQNEQHPIPLVFNLSTWANKRRALKEWLTEEVNLRYDVPRKMAEAWIEANAILPLLDGLDEVASEHQGDCANAINEYRRERGFVPLVACSRMEEYTALTSKLRLEGAIVIQPLSWKQVDEYLKPKPLAGVRSVLRNDPVLQELLDTPLMLSIAVLTYKGNIPAKPRTAKTLDERRSQLFNDYIGSMFDRRGRDNRFSRDSVLYWLSWLASQLIMENITTFFIVDISKEWLMKKQAKYIALVAALFFIASCFWLIAYSGYVFLGSVMGAVVAVIASFLIYFLLNYKSFIILRDIIISLKTTGEFTQLAESMRDIKSQVPLKYWLFIIFAPIGAFVFFPLFALFDLTIRVIVRILLSLAGNFPWRYRIFLDYCVDRIFLRRVGYGYIFVHRLLMEHFASLDTSKPPEEAVAETE